MNIFSEAPDIYNQLMVREGIGFYRFSPDRLQFIHDFLNNNENEYKPHNVCDTLAGNMREEYSLMHSSIKQKTMDLLIDPIRQFSLATPHMHNIDITIFGGLRTADNGDVDPSHLEMDSLWVNYMQKHEFNPIHDHFGTFSFVLWLDIPFDIQEEKRLGPGSKSNSNHPGAFYYYDLDLDGRILANIVEVDKHWNGTMAVFPSTLKHSVNPFYTSDDYRITISGNARIKV